MESRKWDKIKGWNLPEFGLEKLKYSRVTFQFFTTVGQWNCLWSFKLWGRFYSWFFLFKFKKIQLSGNLACMPCNDKKKTAFVPIICRWEQAQIIQPIKDYYFLLVLILFCFLNVYPSKCVTVFHRFHC